VSGCIEETPGRGACLCPSYEGRSVGGPPWEIYLTDPGERPDPQTWETQIILPLA